MYKNNIVACYSLFLKLIASIYFNTYPHCSLTENKSKAIIFTKRNKRQNDFHLQLKNKPIEIFKQIRILGLLFDLDDVHINLHMYSNIMCHH